MQTDFSTLGNLVLSDSTGGILLVKSRSEPWRLPSEQISAAHGDARCQLATSVNRQLGLSGIIQATDLQFVSLVQCLRETRLLLIFSCQCVDGFALSERAWYDKMQIFPSDALPDGLLPLHGRAIEAYVHRPGFDAVTF